MRGSILVMSILTAILVLLFFFQGTLFKTSSRMLTDIDKIKKYVDENNWDGVDYEMARLISEWEETSETFEFFVDHQEVDLMMLSIYKANEYRRYRETPEFMAEIVNLERLVDHIPNKEKFCIENIL